MSEAHIAETAHRYLWNFVGQTHDKPTRKSMLDAVNKVPGSVARYPCSPSSIAPLVLNGGTRRVYEADFVLGRSDWPYY